MVCYWILLPALLRALRVSDWLFPLLLALGREAAGNGACQEPQEANLHPSCPEWTSLLGDSNKMKISRLEWGGGISEPSRLFYSFPQGHRHLRGLLQSTDNKLYLKSQMIPPPSWEPAQGASIEAPQDFGQCTVSCYNHTFHFPYPGLQEVSGISARGVIKHYYISPNPKPAVQRQRHEHAKPLVHPRPRAR